MPRPAPDDAVLMPARLKVGDKVRFVSPASTPDKAAVWHRAAVLESWGLEVDFGEHAFRKLAYLAGTDEERLADLDAAFRDPAVRAIVATRGGKGAYRIADRLDFAAVRRDPKFLVGFSDITILHLGLWQRCRLVGVHGALMDDEGALDEAGAAALRAILMTAAPIVIRARDAEPTAALTTAGSATGRLIGGNLDMLATAAGWSLPKLDGELLLIESVGRYLGQIDRQLTMLRKAGHLTGLAGVAVGQFTGFERSGELTIVELLRQHLAPLAVPILGGLPLGHGNRPVSTLVGALTSLNADTRELIVAG